MMRQTIVQTWLDCREDCPTKLFSFHAQGVGPWAIERLRNPAYSILNLRDEGIVFQLENLCEIGLGVTLLIAPSSHNFPKIPASFAQYLTFD